MQIQNSSYCSPASINILREIGLRWSLIGRVSVLIFLTLLWGIREVQAQPEALNVYTHFGYVARHSDEVQHLARSHIFIVQSDLVFTNWVEPAWFKAWHKPNVGLSALVAALENPTVLGNILGIGVFAEPWLIRRKYHHLSYRLSTGLGYNGVTFDKYSNPTGILMSSHLNCMLQGQFKYSTLLGERLSLQIGFGITHFSNGAFKLPNYGINLLAANLGFQYKLHSDIKGINPNDPAFSDSLPYFAKKWKLQPSMAFALVDIEPGGGKKYPYFIGSLLVAKRIGLKSTLNIGAEYFYNSSLKEVVRMPDTTHFKGPYGRIGLVGGHELHISKISLLTQLGVYLYKKTPIDAPFYFRAGLRYYPKPWLFAGVYLKTHYASADCIEWTIGGSFWGK